MTLILNNTFVTISQNPFAALTTYHEPLSRRFRVVKNYFQLGSPIKSQQNGRVCCMKNHFIES